MRKILNRVSEQGYECMDSPVLLGVLDIGYPIFDHQKNTAGVLMMSILLDRHISREQKLDNIKPYLQQAALDISKAIGYQ
ncbi:hypothetical protein ACVBEJ_10270 [Porticoccus sp. GXU_MW_L64]